MTVNILKFINSQTCASVCCVDLHTKQPYCFSCFYAFNSKDGLLIFKSSSSTNHAVLIKQNSLVAGTILPDKLNPVIVKGIQFEGVVLPFDHPLAINSSTIYHKKLPLALAIPGEIWTIQLNHTKMTDSTAGFGKKISWHRDL